MAVGPGRALGPQTPFTVTPPAWRRARGPDPGRRSPRRCPARASPPAAPSAAAPLPLPIFRAHTLQGAGRAGQAETCPRAGPRVTDRGRHLGAARRGGQGQPRARTNALRRPPASGLIRQGSAGSRADRLRRPRSSYLLLIRQLLLQIRHFPSGDKPRRRRPPDFPLSVRSSAPRAPATKGGARRPDCRARAQGAPPPRLGPRGRSSVRVRKASRGLKGDKSPTAACCRLVLLAS